MQPSAFLGIDTAYIHNYLLFGINCFLCLHFYSGDEGKSLLGNLSYHLSDYIAEDGHNMNLCSFGKLRFPFITHV
jgi:hypothetical protein